MKNSDHLDLNDLRLLLYVVEHGGFTAASKALSIPTSTLSQRITALERAAGTGLLRRTTRSLSLTEAGKLLLPHARAIEDLSREADRALSDLNSEMRGLLRITASVAISQFALGPILPKFLQDYPDIEVRLDATNRYMDLIGEGYDLGFRAYSEQLKDSTLLQRVVARTPWKLAASPGFVERHPQLLEPSDLQLAPILAFEPTGAEPIWELSRDETEVKVSISPALSSDDMATLRINALAGAGITGLPCYILASALDAGELVQVLPDWRLKGSAIAILSPPASQSSRLARAFRDFVVEALPATIEPGVVWA